MSWSQLWRRLRLTKKIAVAIEAESQALMAEEFASRFRGFSTDKCRAAMRALYDEVFVFSISVSDKPFVTFDIRAICWNLKSEARSGRRRSIHHEGMPHRIFRWIRKRKALILQIKVRLLQNIYLRCRAHETATSVTGFEGDHTISAEQECTGVYMPSVGIVVRRKDDSRVEGNMDIWWSQLSIWPCVVCQREWMWIPWDCLEYFVTRMFSCHQYVYHGR
jgi:hypothetical protein